MLRVPGQEVYRASRVKFGWGGSVTGNDRNR